MSKNKDIQFVDASKEVEIHLPDGRSLRAPRGAAIGDCLALIQEADQPLIVGAIVNSALRELTFPVDIESNVVPVATDTSDGTRIYRRSLTFLLEAAFAKTFKKAKLLVDHSVFSGGYFCHVEGRDPLTEDELVMLKARMQEIIDADTPFERTEVPIEEGIDFFTEHNMDDKVRLLKHRKKDYLVLYDLGGFRDYHHGYMVPSSGYLKLFDLVLAGGGFVLRFPRQSKPLELSPVRTVPKLLETFRRYGDWLDLLGISSVGSLNDAIVSGRIREIVLMSEALHEQRVASIATEIANRDDVRIVLVAGPSSSGKTTFSKRLSVQLLAHGLYPFALELDKFFVDRTKTPKDEDGEFDFEHIDAIDRERLNQDVVKLIAGEETQLPHYNFLTGISEEGEKVQLASDQVIIIEGIHGLNPELLPSIPAEKTFRVYLSALTQLNLDRHNRVSTTDTRLIRRIVRDARERGYSPSDTIQRWESVRRGESNYIFPYQDNADVMFNSALVYELAALKPLAEPLLRQVSFGKPEHIEVKRLLALLEWFLPLDHAIIPDNSLLMEFIGGSILKDFSVWQQ
ncbi:MAG: nucleoside kinase [Chloroflexi bacterium]|nr:MAG: nucleoside kinase [Chloroflexota bacterium]MBL1195825.1 nucleoside kinase [Chloroflexota bacterium]NOH13117.1 nucleoside kinase [Chloroflexota bacterium]